MLVEILLNNGTVSGMGIDGLLVSSMGLNRAIKICQVNKNIQIVKRGKKPKGGRAVFQLRGYF